MSVGMHRKIFYVAFCALVLFSARSSSVQAQLEESLLQEGGAGASVVLLSVVRIRQSGIFGGDNDLLPRIAYAETRDGTASDTYRDGYHGGIWAVDEITFLSTQDTALTELFEDIQQEFGLDWPSATWSDLRKPFYSALAARLVLFITQATIPPSTDVQGQANFWVQYYNPSGSTSGFTSAITSTCTRVVSHVQSYPYTYVSTSYYNHPHVSYYSCGFWGWSTCSSTSNHQHSQTSTSYGTNYALVYTLENICCDGFQGNPPNCFLTTIGFSETAYVFSESNSENVQVPVVRSGNTDSTATVVVAADMSSGTASDNDYISVLQAVEFQPGESEKEVTISVVNDQHAEEDEIFELYLTGVTGVVFSPYERTSVIITNEDHVPGQPLNLQQTVLSSSSATITWQAPAITNPHNPLLMYTLLLNEHRFGLPIVTIHVDSSVTSYTFTQLEEFDTYTCMIHAINDVGTGLASSISFTTQEDVPASSPQNLVASALSSTSISLSWMPPPLIDQNGNIREYMVVITENETGDGLEFTSPTTTLTVSSLHPYYYYQCKVSAYTIDHGPYSEDVTVRTLEDVPSGYPESITGVATSPQSVVIAWDPPLPESQNGVITSYVIDVFEVETGDMFQLNSATNSLTIDSLSPYTTYVCVIAAMTSVGLGPFSTNFTIRTLEDVPTSPPQNPVGVASNSRTIFLSWDLPPPREQNGIIREYRINLTEVETGTTWQLTSDTSSITIPMLHPHYTYEWCVSAFTIGDGPCTEISTVMTPEDVPTSPPQNAIGAPHTSTSIILHWGPPPIEGQNGIILMYRINITEVESGRVFQYTTDISALAVSALHPYYTYNWAVSASTIIGYGPYTEISTVVTLEDIPTSPPQNVLGTALDSRTVSLAWDPPPLDGQNGLIREYRINITEVNTGTMWQLTSATNSETVPSLHPNYVYRFEVSAFTIGIGPYSPMLSVMTLEDVPTGYPQDFTGTETSSRSATFTWETPSLEDQNGAITGYVINISVIETGEMFQFFSASNSLALDTLSPFTTYMCIIAATTNIGSGIVSPSITIFTPEDVPTGSPQNLFATSPNSTTISLSWEAPPPREQNGIIRQYWINVTEVITGRSWQLYSTTTTKEVSSLQPYYEYQWLVAAYTTGVGPYSEVSTAITAEDVPSSPPQSPIGVATSSRSIYLSWYPPLDEDQNGIIREYDIIVTEVDTGRILRIATNSTAINMSSLHPYYTYEWIVSAYTIDTGPYTVASTVMTHEDAPTGPPQALNGFAESASSIAFSWQVPLQNETNGIIQYYTVRVTEINTQHLLEFNSNEMSTNVGDLRAYQAYELSIAAFTVGLGPFSASVEVTTLETAPTAPPTNVLEVNVTGETLTLSWDPPPADHHNGVIRQYIILITHTKTNTSFSVISSMTTITIDGLIPLNTYSYSIAAETVAPGPYSRAVLVTLPEGAPSAPPTRVSVTVINSTSFTIIWEAPPPETQNGDIRMYFVKITEVETQRMFQLSTESTSITVSSLRTSYTYEICVSAFTVESGPCSNLVTVEIEPPTVANERSQKSTAIGVGVAVPVGILLVIAVLLVAVAIMVHKRRGLKDDVLRTGDKGSGDFPTPRQPSIHMGTNQLYTYERATGNKKFGAEGHTRPLSSQRSSISSAIGSRFINPMYDDFEDENTDEYARD